MAYWNTQGRTNASLDSFGLGSSTSGTSNIEFYELEPAVVLDLVLDENHAIFKQKSNVITNIDVDRWPEDLKGQKAVQGELDFSWVGRALVRLIFTNPSTQKDKLIWAYPMDNNISEYPLINEVVMIYGFGSKYFYSRRINFRNFPNQSVDFGLNQTISGEQNTELFSNALWAGRKSQTRFKGGVGYEGASGRYYKINNKIRAVKRYEGDTVIESRFGQSIRFAAYDDTRANDVGDPKNVDYKDFGGNPMILIRNRQRKLLGEGESLSLQGPYPKTISGTKVEKNAGGFIKENINFDGSSIHITTGQTITNWVTTCFKKMFGVGEEVGAFQGPTDFQFPTLNGDQVVIQSDRLIFSSRYGETFHYSKKRYAIVTDNEYTLDAHNQIVLTTNTKTVLNSPAIYLGEDNKTDEPVLLGQTTVNLIYDFLELFKAHVHKHDHSHVDAGAPSPRTTQEPIPPIIAQANALQARLKDCLSRRVFTTGGGFAPGQNGGSINGGSEPTTINVGTGAGVPGGWKGASKR